MCRDRVDRFKMKIGDSEITRGRKSNVNDPKRFRVFSTVKPEANSVVRWKRTGVQTTRIKCVKLPRAGRRRHCCVSPATFHRNAQHTGRECTLKKVPLRYDSRVPFTGTRLVPCPFSGTRVVFSGRDGRVGTAPASNRTAGFGPVLLNTVDAGVIRVWRVPCACPRHR